MSGFVPRRSPVTSVQARTGDVVVTQADVGLANVDNTADLAKPVSTATATALAAKLNASAVSAFGLDLVDSPNAAAACATLGLVNSLVTNGSSTLPGGLILKWGTTALLGAESADNVVTFGAAFPTACLNVVGVPGSNNGAVGGTPLNSMSVHTPTAAGFKVDNDGVATVCSWQAIGH